MTEEELFFTCFMIMVIGIGIFAAIRGGRQAIWGDEDPCEIGHEDQEEGEGNY